MSKDGRRPWHWHRGLVDFLVRHAGHFGRPPREIFARVIDDYGTVTERTLWRHLRAALASGQLVKDVASSRYSFETVYRQAQGR